MSLPPPPCEGLAWAPAELPAEEEQGLTFQTEQFYF